MTPVSTKEPVNEAMAAMKPVIRTSLSDEIVERIIDFDRSGSA